MIALEIQRNTPYIFHNPVHPFMQSLDCPCQWAIHSSIARVFLVFFRTSETICKL